MFALILHAEGMGPTRLFYKDAEKAKSIHDLLVRARWPEPGVAMGGVIQITDDFGSEVALAPISLKGCQLIDIKAEAEGACEMQLVQARVKNNAEHRASMDPVLNMQRPAGLVRAS
jgi:hypothetical protein